MDKSSEMDFIKYFAGKQIVVTGGAGYIASSIIKMLANVSCNIIRVDKPGAKPQVVKGEAKITDIVGDVRKTSIWEKILRETDIVFHLAAQTSTYLANENPLDDIEINVLPMLKMLEICRNNNWRPDILFSSTVTVIGIPTKLPVDEIQTGQPVTVYDLHKLMAEGYLKYYANQGLVRGAILRLSNVYGPGPKSSRADRGILNLMVRKALKGESLTVYGEGNCLRDYVYVEDVARAFLMTASNIERVNGQHFIIGSGQGHTISDAINLVADRASTKTGKRADVKHIEPEFPQSPIEARNFVADSRKFSELTGWKAAVGLTEGIDQIIENSMK